MSSMNCSEKGTLRQQMLKVSMDWIKENEGVDVYERLLKGFHYTLDSIPLGCSHIRVSEFSSEDHRKLCPISAYFIPRRVFFG